MELIDWIAKNTLQTDIIAASAPTSATLKLMTARSIIIHPQYENSNLRDKVKQLYRFYGKTSEKDAFEILKPFGSTYLVLDASACFIPANNRCSFVSLYESEFKTDSPIFCQLDFSRSSLFKQVFANSRFRILRVLNPKDSNEQS
jgi:hypothetical protein